VVSLNADMYVLISQHKRSKIDGSILKTLYEGHKYVHADIHISKVTVHRNIHADSYCDYITQKLPFCLNHNISLHNGLPLALR